MRKAIRQIGYLASFTAVLAGAGLVAITAERISQAPLLSDGPAWSEFAIFNPAAIKVDNKTVLLFRAQDRGHTSRIGYAESMDGVHFVIHPEPVLSPDAPYEQGGGLEDPRVIKIGRTYYLTYTGYDLHTAQLCLATSTDLVHWDRKGVILPAYRGKWNTQWTKSGAIVDKKIQNKWWMYYLGTRTDSDGKPRDYMGVAWSDDLSHWTDATDRPVLDRRPEAFDSRVMEPGPPPFVTNRGILLLYNGADEHLVYRPGWVLFDRRDPRRVLARGEKPFADPTLSWEVKGNVPRVIFLEGAVLQATTESHGLQILGYYGAADTYIGAMNIRIDFPSR
jgi:predicted GH43/DUF377 family glycosyl hydrolase